MIIYAERKPKGSYGFRKRVVPIDQVEQVLKEIQDRLKQTQTPTTKK